MNAKHGINLRWVVVMTLGLFPFTFSAAQAQGFNLEWGTADGSGTGRGGNFVMTGTIRCTDIGPMAGGNYTLDEGGYFSMLPIEQRLAIALLTGQLTISWPLSAAGWELDQTAILSAVTPQWTLVPPTQYQTNGTEMTFIVNPAESKGFYRLRKP